VRAFLDQYGLQSSLFDFITISSDFNPPIYKPHPQIFAAAVSNAGHVAASEKLIFVTETLIHINTARQLGWRAIHKPYQASCTAASGECVEALNELLNLLPDQNQNTPPVLEDIPAIVVDENSQVVRTVVATDAQGQPLVFTLNGPPFATLTATSDSTAELVVQPDFEDSGNYLALVRVTDPEGAFDEKSVSITVNNVNRPPVLANIGPLLVHEGSQLIRTITTSDPDLQVVTFNAAGLPAFATFNDEGGGVGTLTLKPDYKDAGLYHTTVTVTDPEGATDSESFSIRVINVLMPLATQINELPFQHNEGVIELKVNNLLPNLASQVQIQSGADWVNITNANGDRAWFHENLVANEVVRYAYGTNALGGLYRWVIYDKAEGLDQGWAVSDPFSISEMGKHIIVEVTLPNP
jgi:hypothetical protein